MTDDIVEQLREEGFVTHMARLPRESKILHAAADEIERLRKERDEARHCACDLFAHRCGVNRQKRKLLYAQHMGWDCFKEKNQ